MIIAFWAAVGLVVYTLFVFPVLLLLRGLLVRRTVRADRSHTPSVTVLVGAYNEADNIRARIENLLAQDYPADRLEIVVASDGSSDETVAIAESFDDPRVRALDLPRGGKGNALNLAVPETNGEILVFTDANTVFAENVVRELVTPFADETVGGVGGDQVYTRDGTPSTTADGERAYWSYDRLLKRLQSRAGSITSATGAIYAIRKSLYTPVPPNAMDDFVISTGVVANGQRLVYNGEAKAFEPVATREGVEFSRKVRIVAQGLAAVLHVRPLLNPFRYGFYSLQLFTHKVLRRLLFAAALVLLVVSPLLWQQGLVYQVATVGQIAFYVMAAVGIVARGRGGRFGKPFAMAYFLCAVNVAAAIATLRTVTGRAIKRWEPERHGSAGTGGPVPS